MLTAIAVPVLGAAPAAPVVVTKAASAAASAPASLAVAGGDDVFHLDAEPLLGLACDSRRDFNHDPDYGQPDAAGRVVGVVAQYHVRGAWADNPFRSRLDPLIAAGVAISEEQDGDPASTNDAGVDQAAAPDDADGPPQSLKLADPRPIRSRNELLARHTEVCRAADAIGLRLIAITYLRGDPAKAAVPPPAPAESLASAALIGTPAMPDAAELQRTIGAEWSHFVDDADAPGYDGALAIAGAALIGLDAALCQHDGTLIRCRVRVGYRFNGREFHDTRELAFKRDPAHGGALVPEVRQVLVDWVPTPR